MLKLLFMPIVVAFEIVSIPFKIIFSLLIPNNTYKKKRYYVSENNIWGLSKEDKRIAKEERMSDADYIEAEERDDDNLDTDD